MKLISRAALSLPCSRQCEVFGRLRWDLVFAVCSFSVVEPILSVQAWLYAQTILAWLAGISYNSLCTHVLQAPLRTLLLGEGHSQDHVGAQTRIRRHSYQVGGRTIGTSSRSSPSRSSCSPKRYLVNLRHGHCVRRIVTEVHKWTFDPVDVSLLLLSLQMCYGLCTSYTYLVTRTASATTALQGIAKACVCCSPVGNSSSRKVIMTCTVGGRRTMKVFYVPRVENCLCRPCVTYWGGSRRMTEWSCGTAAASDWITQPYRFQWILGQFRSCAWRLRCMGYLDA